MFFTIQNDVQYKLNSFPFYFPKLRVRCPIKMSRLQHLFAAYSKFGDTRSNGETITLTQSDKWMKQAKVIGKEITTTDTGICFGKFKL